MTPAECGSAHIAMHRLCLLLPLFRRLSAQAGHRQCYFVATELLSTPAPRASLVPLLMYVTLLSLDLDTLCRCLNFVASLPMWPCLSAACSMFQKISCDPLCWEHSCLCLSRHYIPPRRWNVLRCLWQKVRHLEVRATQAAPASLCQVPLLLNWLSDPPRPVRDSHFVDFEYVLPYTYLRFNVRWPALYRDFLSQLRICVHAGPYDTLQLEELCCVVLLRPADTVTACLNRWHVNGRSVAEEEKALQMCSHVVHEGDDLRLALTVHWTPYSMTVWDARAEQGYRSPVSAEPVFTNMEEPWKWLTLAVFTTEHPVPCPLQIEHLQSPIESVERRFCALCCGYYHPAVVANVCQCGRDVCRFHWCPGDDGVEASCLHCALCRCPFHEALHDACG